MSVTYWNTEQIKNLAFTHWQTFVPYNICIPAILGGQVKPNTLHNFAPRLSSHCGVTALGKDLGHSLGFGFLRRSTSSILGVVRAVPCIVR